jgi:hypothetical protein
VTALRAFGPWIAAKKCRQVLFKLLSCRSGHEIRRRIDGTGHNRTCRATRQENEHILKNINKDTLLFPKNSSNNWKRDFEIRDGRGKVQTVNRNQIFCQFCSLLNVSPFATSYHYAIKRKQTEII